MKFLIIGLGNIGPKYHKTRHNIGFDVLDHMVEEAETTWSTKKLGDIAEIKHRGKKLILLKPSTFMNRSGKSVHYWMQKENIKIDNILVIVDDLNLDYGRIRIRAKGSDGGHNGLRDIQSIITTKYARLRFGIGDTFSKGKQVDFVLGKWSTEEIKLMPELLDKTSESIKSFTHIGLQRTMSQFNN